MKELFWICPNCGNRISFTNQLYEIFDHETGEAIFDPETGVFFHTLVCDGCCAEWVMAIGRMITRKGQE